ncbi:hypothetical protein OH77DRAFT_269769 [Trametes cingulata]|nr:hypothetical protein OH77DRAFT_269769 [Trametes cingulata]
MKDSQSTNPTKLGTEGEVFDPQLATTLDPFCMLVRAMAALHGAHTPATVFCQGSIVGVKDVSPPPVRLHNPLKEYEQILLELRQLYSRPCPSEKGNVDYTGPIALIDREIEMGEPSTTPGSHAKFARPGDRNGRVVYYTGLKDVIRKLKCQDGGCCVLCGAKDNIVVRKVVLHHDSQEIPFFWLKSLGVLPKAYKAADDVANYMLLCEPHATAYDLKVWRFMPAKDIREKMLQRHAKTSPDYPADQTEPLVRGYTTPTRASEVIPRLPGDELQPENAVEGGGLFDDPTMGNKTAFELIIYLPHSMPRKDLRGAAYVGEDFICVKEFESDNPRRVFPGWSLPLNPYVVFASALCMAGAAYFPFPDDALLSVEDECLRIREALNETASADQSRKPIARELSPK